MSKALNAREVIRSATSAATFCFLLALLFSVAGCTFVQYTETPTAGAAAESPEPAKTVTVLDFHPAGSAIDFEAVLQGKGSLTVNREQGTAEGMVDNAVRAATGGWLGPLQAP